MYEGEVQNETLIVGRDPVERFVSGYRNARDKRGLELDFAEFVQRFPELMAANRDWAHHFRAQWEFFPEHPLDQIDHVFDFGDFEEVRKFLEERAGKSLPRYHEQKSNFDDFTVTDQDVDLIQEYFLEDYLKGFGELYDCRNKESRRLVATSVVGDLPFARETVPRIRKYAREIGADFRLVTRFENRDQYHGSAYYLAVDLLRRFSRQTEYEELLLLDADVLIGREVPDVFPDLHGAEIAWAADNCHETQDSHFKEWLEKNEFSMELHTPGGTYYNSGVILISLEGARKLDFSGPYPVCPWYDQDFLNLRICQAGLEVKQLDRSWNFWPEGQIYQDLAGGRFLHLVGPRKSLVSRYAARLEREKAEVETVPFSAKRIFLLLCREPGPRVVNLSQVLSDFGKVLVISDTECGEELGLHLKDVEMHGFELMNFFEGQRKAVTAWERGWKLLAERLGEITGPVWFVEDDVAGGAEAWSELIEATERVDADFSACEIRSLEDDQGWKHWRKGAGFFQEPARSFNPLCRVSARLVLAVLEFRRQHGRFCFLEMIFASLVREHGLSYFDWKEDALLASTTEEFRYRPEVQCAGAGICHPVKDEAVHGALCLGESGE